MKKLLYLSLSALLFTACTKNNDSGGGDASGQLLPASTGWKTVSSVHYAGLASGFPRENSMTPYDLTMVGNDVALLYSDDYKLTGGARHVIMKLMMTGLNIDAKTNATRLNYDRGDDVLQIHRFIPGSFQTLSGKFSNNEILVYDENGGPNAGQHFGSINALPTLRWLADGSIIAGLKDGPYSSAYWSYQYPNIGNFNYVVNVWNGDSTRNVLSSPFKLSDGTLYDMTFSQLNGRMYFSVLKNTHAPQTGTAPNYQMICRNTVPDLDGTKSYAVVTSDVQNDAAMIMVAEVDYSTGVVQYKRVVTYRWQKGSAALEKLYSADITDQDLGRTIMTLTTNTKMPNEVRLTPDGSAYFLRTYSPMVNTSPSYTALVIINQNGVKETGRINTPDMEAIKHSQFELHCCRYLKGAFYAVVHPAFEYEHTIYEPEYRIEIVKIIP